MRLNKEKQEIGNEICQLPNKEKLKLFWNRLLPPLKGQEVEIKVKWPLSLEEKWIRGTIYRVFNSSLSFPKIYVEVEVIIEGEKRQFLYEVGEDEIRSV